MYLHRPRNHWIPAGAGMTVSRCGNHDEQINWNKLSRPTVINDKRYAQLPCCMDIRVFATLRRGLSI